MPGHDAPPTPGEPSGDSAEEALDFVLAAYREDGRWQVEVLPLWAGQDLDILVAALRQRPGDHGALGLVSVDEDFFVLVRVVGHGVRLLLSDVTAATEWPLARAVVGRLGLPVPDEEEEVQPAGDLGLLADLGIDAMELAAVCDDLDSYPEELLADVAGRLGFAREFDAAVEAVR